MFLNQSLPIVTLIIQNSKKLSIYWKIYRKHGGILLIAVVSLEATEMRKNKLFDKTLQQQQ
jgi:hypothetical protein